jgi:hypothetical protein
MIFKNRWTLPSDMKKAVPHPGCFEILSDFCYISQNQRDRLNAPPIPNAFGINGKLQYIN